MRKAIPVVKRVAVTLWRLSTNLEYRTIDHLFGISRSTVCVIVHEVCRAINKVLVCDQVVTSCTLHNICEHMERYFVEP